MAALPVAVATVVAGASCTLGQGILLGVGCVVAVSVAPAVAVSVVTGTRRRGGGDGRLCVVVRGIGKGGGGVALVDRLATAGPVVGGDALIRPQPASRSRTAAPSRMTTWCRMLSSCRGVNSAPANDTIGPNRSCVKWATS